MEEENEDYWFVSLVREISDLQREYCDGRPCRGCGERLRGLVRVTEGGGADYCPGALAAYGLFGKDTKEQLEKYVELLNERIEERKEERKVA